MTKQPNYSSLRINHLLSFLVFVLLIPANVVISGFNYDTNTSRAFEAAATSESAKNPVNPKGFLITNASSNAADYTLLVYMIGSDLESQHYSATKDLMEMKSAANSSKVNLVIQTGGGGGKPGKSSTSGIERFVDFSTVQRHHIANGTLNTLMDLGVKNMAQPDSLLDFIKWGVSNFPARKYAIILWDHGSGLNGFGNDILFENKKSALTLSELKRTFVTAENETGVHFELIGFDACLMSSLEMASRLYNVADYMVSSEEVEPSWGWDYKAIMDNLTADSKQSGRELGVAIADTFVRHSEENSKLENFGANRDITLSVIDLSRIPQLLNDVNMLSKAIKAQVHDLPSALNLSKSIDLTEDYGRSSQASSGLIDLFDLTENLQDKYPSISRNIEVVQNSLKSASIFTVSGQARPNAHGISIYLPLNGNGYDNKSSSKEELYVVDIDWFTLLNIQKSMMTTDSQPPILKSIKEGRAITASVFGSDISSIFAQIAMNSSDGGNLIYVQNVDPSIIDNDGFLNYKKNEMLVICNESKCLPASMNLEVNRDRKFAFIPARLESDKEGLNQNVSLSYEINKDGNLDFLGIVSEINPQQTIPKEKFNFNRNDKIYTKALPDTVEVQHVGDFNSQKLRNSSRYIEDGPLMVNDPARMKATFVNITSPFSISFTICDYSDNCDKTRWYNIDPSLETLPQLSTDTEFGYEVAVDNNKTSLPKLAGNFYTYINPTFGFKFEYPSDWTRESQNIYSDLSNDLFSDPTVVNLSPSHYIGLKGSSYRPSMIIQANDWHFKESPKYLFDIFNSSNPMGVGQDYKIIASRPVLVAGNPGFMFIIEYTSKEEQSLGLEPQKRIEAFVTTLMNGRMYTITFSSYSEQFREFVPVVENMIKSFKPYYSAVGHSPSQNQPDNTTVDLENGILTNLTSDMNDISTGNSASEKEGIKNYNSTTLNGQNMTSNISFSTYIDDRYGYIIQYPSNVGLGKPVALQNVNSKLAGNLFSLDNSSEGTSNPAESADVIVAAFYTNETDLIRKLILTPSLPNQTNFNIDTLASIAGGELSFYKMLPGFILLENTSKYLNNNPAYIIEYKYFNPVLRTIVQTNEIYVLENDRLLVFQYTANPLMYYTHKPIFQEMVNSLRFEERE